LPLVGIFERRSYSERVYLSDLGCFTVRILTKLGHFAIYYYI
jgi:hypothetical protein